MGSDAAAVRELQIELVLATRKLDACSNHTGVSLGFFGGIDGSIVPSAKPVQAIEAAVHLSGHLFRSAKAQHLRNISITHQSAATPIASRAMLAAAMLRLLTHLVVPDDTLSAARASRNQGDLTGALFEIAKSERASTTQVGFLDVFGVWIMNHDE